MSAEEPQAGLKKGGLDSLSHEELVAKCKNLLIIAQKAKKAKDDALEELANQETKFKEELKSVREKASTDNSQSIQMKKNLLDLQLEFDTCQKKMSTLEEEHKVCNAKINKLEHQLSLEYDKRKNAELLNNNLNEDLNKITESSGQMRLICKRVMEEKEEIEKDFKEIFQQKIEWTRYLQTAYPKESITSVKDWIAILESQKSCDNFEEENKILKDTNEEMKKKMEKLEKVIEDLIGKKDGVTNEIASLKNEKLKMSEELNEVRISRDALLKKMDEVRIETTQLIENSEKLSEENGVLRMEKDKIQNSFASLTVEHAKLLKEIEVLKMCNEELNEKMGVMRMELEEGESEKGQEMREKLKEMEEMRIKLKEMEELRMKLVEMKEVKSAEEEKVRTNLKEMESMKLKLEEMENLEIKLKEVEGKSLAGEKEIENLSIKLNEMKGKKLEGDKEIENLSIKLNEMENKKLEGDKEIENLRIKLNEIEGKKLEGDKEIENLSIKLNEMENKKLAGDKDLENLGIKLKETEIELDRLRNENNLLETDKKFVDNRVAELENLVGNLKEKIVELTKNLEETTQEGSEKLALSIENADLKKQLETLMEDRHDLKKQLENLSEENFDLKKQLGTLSEENVDLKKHLETLLEKNTELSKSIKHRDETIDNIKNKYDNYEWACNEFKQDNLKKINFICELQMLRGLSNRAEFDKEIEKLKQELDEQSSLEDQIGLFRKLEKLSRQQIEELREIEDMLRKKLVEQDGEKEKIVNELNERCERLKEEVEKLIQEREMKIIEEQKTKDALKLTEAQLIEKLNEVERQLQDKNSEFEDFQSTKFELIEKLNLLEQELQLKNSEYEAFRSLEADWIRKLNEKEWLEKVKNALINDKIRLEQEKGALETEKMELENDKIRLEQQKMQLENDKIRLEQEKGTLETEKMQLENDKIRLEQEKGALETKKMQSENDKIRLEQEKGALETEKMELITEKMVLENDKIRLEQEKGVLENDNKRLEKEKNVFEKEKNVLKSKIEKLESIAKESSDELGALKVSDTDLQKKLEDYEEMQKNLEECREKLRENLENNKKTEEIIDDLKCEAGKLNSLLVVVQEERDNASSSLHKCQLEKRELETKVEKLRLEDEENLQNLQDLNDRYLSMEEKLNFIFSENEELKGKVVELEEIHDNLLKEIENIIANNIQILPETEVNDFQNKSVKFDSLVLLKYLSDIICGLTDSVKDKDLKYENLSNKVEKVGNELDSVLRDLKYLERLEKMLFDGLSGFKDGDIEDKVKVLNEFVKDSQFFEDLCESYASKMGVDLQEAKKIIKLKLEDQKENGWKCFVGLCSEKQEEGEKETADEVRVKEEEILQLQEKNKELKGIAVKMKKKIGDLNQLLETERQKVDAERNKLSQLSAVAKNAQMLQQECDRLTDELEDCKKTIKQLQKVNDSLENEHKELQQKYNEKENRFEGVEKEMAALKTQLENAVSKESSIIKEMEEVRTEKHVEEVIRKECEKELIMTQDKLRKVQLELDQALLQSEKHTVLTQEKHDYEQQLNQSHQTQTQLESKLKEASSTLAQLTSQLETERRDRDELADQLTKLTADSQKTIEAARVQNEALLNRVSQLESDLRSISADKARFEEESQRLEREFAAYKVRAQSVLSRQKEAAGGGGSTAEQEARDKCAQLEDMCERTRAQLDATVEELEQVKMKLDSVVAEKAAMDKKCENINNIVLQRNKEIDRRMMEHRQHKLSTDTLIQCYKSQLEEKERGHQIELESLRQQLSKLSSRVNNADQPDAAKVDVDNYRTEHTLSSAAPHDNTRHSPIDIVGEHGRGLPPRPPLIEREDGEGSEGNEISMFPGSLSNKNGLVPLAKLLSSSLGSDEKREVLSLEKFESLQNEMLASNARVKHLSALLSEAEKDSALMEEQNAVLKEEIRRLQRCIERQPHAHNVEYLKNVVFKFVTLGSGDEKIRLVPVLDTILKLSPEEHKQLTAVAKGETDQTSGWSSYLPTWQ